MKKHPIKRIMLSLLLGVISLGHLAAQSHSVFVLDTSISVLQANYFGAMKQNIKDIASGLHEEDQISLFRFDTDVEQILSKEVINQESFEAIIDQLEAQGQWTYTELMLKEVVDFLQNEYGRSVNLFIFSDGINDPPPNQSVSFGSYTNSDSNLRYYYNLDRGGQKNFIEQAFPDIISQKITDDREQNLVYITSELDAIVPNIEIEVQENSRGLLFSGVAAEFSLNVIANKAVEGKEGILDIAAGDSLFKKAPERQIRFILQEGVNNFRLPYEIKNTFQGRESKMSYTVSLAENPEKKLSRKDVLIEVASLPLLERFYKLPLYGIPAVFFIIILLYVLYRALRYYFFIPVIQISYQLVNKKNPEEKGAVNTLDMGVLETGSYSISSQPNAFLVLPELSRYSNLILIKKGKKFKTKLLVHKKSLHSLTSLQSKRIKRRKIRNGTTFQLENYIFSFKTNLD
jgi:hypothetical protein